jgi:hypothetical protein
MVERRKWHGWKWRGACAAVLLAVYIGGYFASIDLALTSRHICRSFQSSPVAFAYSPLGWLECKIRRRTVCIEMPGRSEYEERMLVFEP